MGMGWKQTHTKQEKHQMLVSVMGKMKITWCDRKLLFTFAVRSNLSEEVTSQ